MGNNSQFHLIYYLLISFLDFKWKHVNSHLWPSWSADALHAVGHGGFFWARCFFGNAFRIYLSACRLATRRNHCKALAISKFCTNEHQSAEVTAAPLRWTSQCDAVRSGEHLRWEPPAGHPPGSSLRGLASYWAVPHWVNTGRTAQCLPHRAGWSSGSPSQLFPQLSSCPGSSNPMSVLPATLLASTTNTVGLTDPDCSLASCSESRCILSWQTLISLSLHRCWIHTWWKAPDACDHSIPLPEVYQIPYF